MNEASRVRRYSPHRLPASVLSSTVDAEGPLGAERRPRGRQGGSTYALATMPVLLATGWSLAIGNSLTRPCDVKASPGVAARGVLWSHNNYGETYDDGDNGPSLLRVQHG